MPNDIPGPPAAVRDRIIGCLLGGAIGDALGWPVEFLSLAAIRRRYGAAGIREFDARAEGGLGAITDDTQMTLFTAEGLLDGLAAGGAPGALDVALAAAYQRWLVTQAEGEPAHDAVGLLAVRALHARRAPGTTCLAALGAVAAGHVPLGAPATNDRKGCGGVMRVAPIGCVPAGRLPAGDPFDVAVRAARLTHGHPDGYLSAGAYATMVHALVHGGATLPEAVALGRARLAAVPGHEETTAALARAVALAAKGAGTAERVEALGGGWVGEEALAMGVYCAQVADGDLFNGVRLAVNHSGDSDSTGSIAGGLLGAVIGSGAVPEPWIHSVELGATIADVADAMVDVGGRGSEVQHARDAAR